MSDVAPADPDEIFTDRIVTVTATIMDGTVVRWYASVNAAENRAMCGIISASRNGVLGGGDYITPADWDAAWYAHQELTRDRSADLKHLATHRVIGLNGMLTTIEEKP